MGVPPRIGVAGISLLPGRSLTPAAKIALVTKLRAVALPHADGDVRATVRPAETKILVDRTVLPRAILAPAAGVDQLVGSTACAAIVQLPIPETLF